MLVEQRSVSGSPITIPATIHRMLEFASRHQINPVPEHSRFDQLNESLVRLENGQAHDRIGLSHGPRPSRTAQMPVAAKIPPPREPIKSALGLTGNSIKCLEHAIAQIDVLLVFENDRCPSNAPRRVCIIGGHILQSCSG